MSLYRKSSNFALHKETSIAIFLNYKFTDFYPNQCYPLYMRPTKSKEQLAYYKHLLALDKKRTELSNRKDDEDNYIEIPRTLIGYKIKLIPVDSLKNRDDGLA